MHYRFTKGPLEVQHFKWPSDRPGDINKKWCHHFAQIKGHVWQISRCNNHQTATFATVDLFHQSGSVTSGNTKATHDLWIMENGKSISSFRGFNDFCQAFQSSLVTVDRTDTWRPGVICGSLANAVWHLLSILGNFNYTNFYKISKGLLV